MSTTHPGIFAKNVPFSRGRLQGRERQRDGWPFVNFERKAWAPRRCSRAQRRHPSKNALRKAERLASWQQRQALIKQFKDLSPMAQKTGRGEVRLDSGRIHL